MPRWTCLARPASSSLARLMALTALAACEGPVAPVADTAGGFTLADAKAGPKDAALPAADAESDAAPDAASDAPADAGPIDAEPVADAEPDATALPDATLDVADAAPPDVKPDVPDAKPDAPDVKPDVKDVKDVKDTGPDLPPPPTFAEVWTKVIEAPTYGCAATKCHGTKPDTPGLDLFTSQATAYDRLVNKPAKFIGCKNKTLVVPGSPDDSVLFTKVMPDAATCGAKMPEAVDSTGILEADALLIQDWILAGAKP